MADRGPAAGRHAGPTAGRAGASLVVACGALVREVRAVLAQLPDVDVDVEYLPANLHNRPERITGAVCAVLDAPTAAGYDHKAVAYGDCGTGGLLDAALAERDVPRLAGAHCYEVVSGAAVFDALQEAEPGTFYLTDYLVRHFDALVMGGLGLDRHPELRDAYFGQLPPRRPPRPDRLPGAARRGRGGGRPPRAGLRAPRRRPRPVPSGPRADPGAGMTDTILSSATREVVIGFDRPFVMIGERINPTGRKLLAEEMKAGDFSRVEADAVAQVAAGAHMLDVNAGIPLADEPALLARAMQLVQAVVDVPLSIDSSIIPALEAGLAVYQGKPLVNSVTGEDEVMERVLPLVAKYGAAVVAISNDETGISEDPDVRFSVAQRIVHRAADHGILGYVRGIAGMHDVDDFPEAEQVPGPRRLPLRLAAVLRQRRGLPPPRPGRGRRAPSARRVARPQRRGQRRGRHHRASTRSTALRRELTAAASSSPSPG